jgi:hypothetical protein
MVEGGESAGVGALNDVVPRLKARVSILSPVLRVNGLTFDQNLT